MSTRRPSPPASSSTSPGSKQLEPLLKMLQLDEADPSTLPFLRGYTVGFTATIVPALVRILLGVRKRGFAQVLKALVKAFGQALNPRGLALAMGVAFGGAKWGESRVEGLVRMAYLASLRRLRARRKGKRPQIEELPEEEEVTESYRNKHEPRIKALSTYISATISALVAITLLQSRSSARTPRAAVPTELDLGVSPYPSLDTSSSPSTPRPSSRPAVSSPTLDLTLFVFVRATDVLVRAIYEAATKNSKMKGRRGSLISTIATHSDTLVFWASCWRIMWCWFYLPERLPPSYNKWILRLARLDPNLLALLQFARNGEYVYGRRPSQKVAAMCERISTGVGREASFANPEYIKRLDCSVVHGQIGRGTCEVNAIKRWLYGFRDSAVIYLPVHLIPQLLFNLRGLVKRPAASVLHILVAASRSSAFLATFLTSIYAAVCLVRSRLPLFIPSLSPQMLDSGLGTGLGCFLCGFSVLIENKRRRREMALYVAPRALYATMEELVPRAVLHGKWAEVLARYCERAIFACSTGAVISAAVHRPDLVSGVVRGVVGFAVGDWGSKSRKAG